MPNNFPELPHYANQLPAWWWLLHPIGPDPGPERWWDAARLSDVAAALQIRTLADQLVDQGLKEQVVDAISAHPAVAQAALKQS